MVATHENLLRKIFQKLGFAEAPLAIRDELLILQYRNFRKNLPYLYLTLFFGVVSCSFALSAENSIIFRYVMPCFVGFMCLWRMGWWYAKRNKPIDPADTSNFVQRTAVIGPLVGTVCGIWSGFVWGDEMSIFRYYIPAFMALGAFSTAFCLAMTPKIATYCVLSGVIPISSMLILSGTLIDFALGVTMLASTIFLIALIQRQYRQLLDMIELRQQMHQMAHTDSLTGLLNRRAFHELVEDNIENGSAQTAVSLAMMDLDGFKPVNDTHGHYAGDALLIELADRMAQHIDRYAYVARLGGDEFAILFLDRPPAFCEQMIEALMQKLSAPCHILGETMRVGVSYGIERIDKGDSCNPAELMRRADKNLYMMKAARGRAARGRKGPSARSKSKAA